MPKVCKFFCLQYSPRHESYKQQNYGKLYVNSKLKISMGLGDLPDNCYHGICIKHFFCFIFQKEKKEKMVIVLASL